MSTPPANHGTRIHARLSLTQEVRVKDMMVTAVVEEAASSA